MERAPPARAARPVVERARLPRPGPGVVARRGHAEDLQRRAQRQHTSRTLDGVEEPRLVGGRGKTCPIEPQLEGPDEREQERHRRGHDEPSLEPGPGACARRRASRRDHLGRAAADPAPRGRARDRERASGVGSRNVASAGPWPTGTERRPRPDEAGPELCGGSSPQRSQVGARSLAPAPNDDDEHVVRKLDVVGVVPGRAKQQPSDLCTLVWVPLRGTWCRRDGLEPGGELLLEQVGCLLAVLTSEGVDLEDVQLRERRSTDRLGHPRRRARSFARTSSAGTVAPFAA